MNAARWDASNDPWAMLDWRIGDCSVRQQGLWGLACLRRVQDWLPPGCDGLLAEIEASLERTDSRVGAVGREAREAVIGPRSDGEPHVIAALRWLPTFAKTAVGVVADAIAERETGFTERRLWPQPNFPVRYREIWRREQAVHAGLLREVRGNPYRPVAFDPAGRTPDVLALARHSYDARDFAVLPILADALQEAGCTANELLNHLRDPYAEHVRGCWALDLALGKS